MNYVLPKKLTVGGTDYDIRWDFRAALDICAAISDPELDDEERAEAALNMLFYPDADAIPYTHRQEAIDKCFWYLGCGEESASKKPAPKLMDWEQDFSYIVAPVNRVVGQEIRALPYGPAENVNSLHWWTFISAYYEIGGDCTFAQIVGIRSKLRKHKPLDKSEQAFYREHREMIDFKTRYTDDEEAFIMSLTGKR